MVLTFSVVCCGLLALLCESVFAECPHPHDLDVKYNSTHYNGAYFFYDQASRNAIQSCKGLVVKFYEGYQITFAKKTIGEHALVVRPGCLVYEFSDYDYQGEVTEYRTGVHPDIARGTTSFKVRCNIPHFYCTPTDRYEAVLTCDATAAMVETECNYIKTIGTVFRSSVSTFMSMDSKLEAEMSASFWDLFKSTLRVSVSTGYNWNQVSEHTKETTQRFEVRTTTPAGFVVMIEQAVGYCGGNKVNTELFRITHNGKRTDTLETKYFKSSKNETNSKSQTGS